MIDVSIVFPTANRKKHLVKCLESVRAHIGKLSYEFVIVDGGSTDGTAEYLADQSDVRLIQHGGLFGSNKAFRDGLKAARGEYVCQLSDDVEIVDDCILVGVARLDNNPKYGQIAFYYQNPWGEPMVGLTNMFGRRVIYTAFGITPKVIGDLVDWWSPEYYQQYGDPDFSCKIWEAGYEVVALPGYCVKHHYAERPPELRKHYREDAAKYTEHWKESDG